MAVALACLVPISAGLSGMLSGAALLGGGTVDLDSHVRYLSGLLLGIGICFASGIRGIESRTSLFRLLTFIVVIGGIGRLLGLYRTGIPSAAMQAALVMELIVTPLLCAWQYRIARKAGKI